MICKDCGKDKDLNIENFHSHIHNKTGFYGSCRVCRNDKRNNSGYKYPYFYELKHGDEIKTGKIKARNKDSATRIIKIKFHGWEIKKLCTFKYKNQDVVKKRGGNKC